MTHVFTASVIQVLPLDRRQLSRAAGQNAHARLAVPEHHDADDGIAVLRCIPEFSRPALARAARIGRIWSRSQHFSTSRAVREDYFGRGADNASFF